MFEVIRRREAGCWGGTALENEEVACFKVTVTVGLTLDNTAAKIIWKSLVGD